MNGFDYGDSHPTGIDHRQRKREADTRIVKHYADKLAQADAVYLGGGDSMMAGIALFDREIANIRRWQMWSAEAFVASRGDTFAAEMCRGYSLAGVHLDDLRLHVTEKIRWLEVCIAACRQLGDHHGEGVALANLGIAWKNLGDVRKAISCHDQALALLREKGDRRGEGNSLNNLGIAWAALGDMKQAIGFYGQALMVSKEIGDRRGEGDALCNLGNAWKNLGDARKAIEFYLQTLAIAQEIGDHRGEGSALGNMGLAWKNLGDARKAIDFYDETLIIARKTGDRRAQERALNNLGSAWGPLEK